jgi:hypothetical protein
VGRHYCCRAPQGGIAGGITATRRLAAILAALQGAPARTCPDRHLPGLRKGRSPDGITDTAAWPVSR